MESTPTMTERHRILIVDDDALDRNTVVRALRREAAHLDGVEADVLEVDTVARAREAIHAEEFACVFLDHSLPDGTSLDLLIELRGQGLTTPIVVLTGERDEQTIMEVMKAGAVDYLPKERLHPDLVVRSLRAALRFQQSQREKQAILEELRARDRAVAAATNGIVLADPRQPDCPLVYVNDAFLKNDGVYPRRGTRTKLPLSTRPRNRSRCRAGTGRGHPRGASLPGIDPQLPQGRHHFLERGDGQLRAR